MKGQLRKSSSSSRFLTKTKRGARAARLFHWCQPVFFHQAGDCQIHFPYSCRCSRRVAGVPARAPSAGEGEPAVPGPARTPTKRTEGNKRTREEAEETLAAQTVPHEQRVGRAPLPELHVDGLGAQPHLQVTQLHDGVAVPLLQPVGELLLAAKESTGAETALLFTVFLVS